MSFGGLGELGAGGGQEEMATVVENETEGSKIGVEFAGGERSARKVARGGRTQRGGGRRK